MAYPKSIIALGLLLFLSGNPGFAQGYESIFGDSSTSWKVYTDWQGYRVYIDSIHTKKDTTIDNIIYKKIKLNSNYRFAPPKYDFDSFGFLREDTISGKAWFRENGKEHLLMDLSLQKGDTFFMSTPWLTSQVKSDIRPGNFIIADSVFTKNQRKYIFFEELSKLSDLSFYFIEGVGTTYGFGYHFRYVFEKDYYSRPVFLCSYKNQKKQFENHFFDKKYLPEVHPIYSISFCLRPGIYNSPIGRQPNKWRDEVQVFPNPAFKQVNIQLPEGAKRPPYTFSLWNEKGKPIREQHFTRQRFSLERKNLTPGLYLYRLTNQGGKILKSGKLIFKP